MIKEKDTSADYIVFDYDKGNGSFKPEYGDQKINESGAKVYYTGGFNNNEWLKRFVFDRDSSEEYASLKIAVDTKAAGDVTETDIDIYNFIYIAEKGGAFLKDVSKNGYGAGRDINADAAKKILKRASTEDLPILAEKAVLDGADSVMKYLIDALCSDDYSEAYNKFDGVSGDGSNDS